MMPVRPVKPSVLVVLPNLQGGGAERVILTILRHLDRSQFTLSLVVIDGREAAFSTDLPDDVETIYLDYTRVRYSVMALISLVRMRRPDIIFSVLGHLNLLLTIVKPFFPRGTKLIIRETVVLSSNLIGNRFAVAWKWAYRSFFPRCDAIICQSSDMRNDLVAAIGVRSRNISVLQNPVDVERVRSLSRASIGCQTPLASSHCGDEIQLVAAGRLVYQKGFDLLIEAIALLSNVRFHVTIIGKGPLYGELEHLAAKLGVASQVRLVGFLENPYPYFKAADAFVLSSRFEGMPNVILEALACGTAVIATPAPGGVNELLQGRTRCLVAKSVSARGIAEALESYNFSKDSNRVPFDLDEYSVEWVCNRYGELFRAVANQAL